MTRPPPFTVLEETFRLQSAEPHPLVVDGRQLGHGVPRRQVPIVDLRWIVTRPTASSDLHDRVIKVVPGRIRQHRAAWVAVLGGLVLRGPRAAHRFATPLLRLAQAPGGRDGEADGACGPAGHQG
jgi:hypothetical protein